MPFCGNCDLILDNRGRNGKLSYRRTIIVEPNQPKEYVYFARPDSLLYRPQRLLGAQEM
jgi:hypothetical protein